MPIANCFVDPNKIAQPAVAARVTDWAEQTQVNPKDITLNLITEFVQLGNPWLTHTPDFQ